MRSFMFFFFFSSRRRHTSFSRDWSSDVCSSDLAALCAVEDPAQRLRRALVEAVLTLRGELLCDSDQLVRRVVRKRDLPREARMQARVRLEEAAHQRRIAGDDHDEAVAMILHALQQRLDRLRAEVLPSGVAARERVRLVDEEHAVERALDRAVRLDRRRADVLTDEPRAVHLDEMAPLEQSHRAVHLREQARDRRLARARIAEEDEVLTRRDFSEPVLLPARLHLEERDQRAHLLLHRVEPDQRVELGLKIVERALLLLPRHAELIRKIVADGLADALAERAQRVGGVVERVAAHAGTLSTTDRSEGLSLGHGGPGHVRRTVPEARRARTGSHGTRTSAPRTSPRRSLASASFACSSGNTSTCVRTGTRGASARNSSPSRRVRFATERSTRSPQSNSYGNDGMSLMWIPAHTTVPPFATAASAAGTSSPAGAKMIAASSSSGGLPAPAHSAPSSRANACASTSRSRVTANTRRPSCRATCATMCAAAPKPYSPTRSAAPATRSDLYPISPAQSRGAACTSSKPSGMGKQKRSSATVHSAYPPSMS